MGFLKGKVALVTGAARGIGRDIASLFAQEGAGLVCVDMDKDNLREIVDDIIKNYGVKAVGLACDISQFEQVESMFKEALNNFDRVDILVNNAGITRDNLILRMTEEEWDLVLKVNLKGAFNCSKVVSKHMIKNKSGRIINIASIIGIIGNAGQANYAASKGGLIAFSKSLARELAGRNINVNAIAPGFIQTKMTEQLPDDIKNKMLENIPLRRFGQPLDVAKAALFLAGEMSSYITAQVIVVDGGML
ncbi:MAG: 3-oxoacyl-[acyl-carrier-protein] reductase [Candidatus Omnitrophica bacterium]|nr:3-oxoacyl-[acyl-carrier-protein] reductase [Candidatus Omnitrophota bacterium]